MKRTLMAVGLVFGGWLAMAGPAAASTSGKTVLLIGDSLASQVADEARTDLSSEGWTVVTLGVGGTGLTHGTPAWQMGATFDWPTQLASMEQTYDPDIVVVMLGTNDVFSVEQGEDYAPQVSRLLASTDAPQVYWSDIATHTSDPLRNAAATSINAAIVGNGRPKVVPYDSTIASVAENLHEDGLHMSPTGEAAMASLLTQELGIAPK